MAHPSAGNLLQSLIGHPHSSIVSKWTSALSARDYEMASHSQRVADLASRLAITLGVQGSDLVNIYHGALLHDIGKLKIPDRILFKTGQLSKHEWAKMKEHPGLGYGIVSRYPFTGSVLDIPHCHHEQWDGGGYPFGLKRFQIPFSARLFAVVDVYDALISNRPYRVALAQSEALNLIADQAGKHFDPVMTEAFLQLMT